MPPKAENQENFLPQAEGKQLLTSASRGAAPLPLCFTCLIQICFWGASFQVGHSPLLRRRFWGLWSQHLQRAASGTRGQDLACCYLPQSKSVRLLETRKCQPKPREKTAASYPQVIFSGKAPGQLSRPFAKQTMAIDQGSPQLVFSPAGKPHAWSGASRNKDNLRSLKQDQQRAADSQGFSRNKNS